ncbi:MAG: HD domain-containing protein [Rhizomicrobium sp.]
MSHCPHCAPSRRRVLVFGVAALLLPALPVLADGLPAEVAGVAIPRTPLALKAAAYARQSYPDFLFNHCMRTFLFGALALGKAGRTYDADKAFAAAALHDLGLIQSFESKTGSFEIDGADAAEKFARGAGVSAAGADTIWHAIVFHDGRWAIARRAGAEAMLVSAGAGADVVGPDDAIAPEQIAEIVAAFPRLQFKRRFTELAAAHCRRKPQSQQGTWLEGLCREQVPSAFATTTEQQIAAAPFAE